ncbi:glycosyltransferase family 4 protein [Alkaliphilus pronyensis]|uniref:Glycosyltransferase family 4 protein n=1 Tax=Alkaliphilus pronyensis TaxID=1482732 RepID=A0A6I0FAM9_9FIRM|nr:glycosyltransferase [Alkaliphilus pronyensis]KAB3534735.1 glycosyltransferase family 4 protein [Alkaliphilus pronyensis]
MLGDVNVSRPRVIVISNSAFSKTKNNGKTLASFFSKFDYSEVAQLYFNHEKPTSDYFKKYYRITDIDILKSLILRHSPGQVVNFESKIETNNTYRGRYKKGYLRNEFFRIIREIAWISKKWKNENLNEWLDDFEPQIVFLCAGDTGFAYDIANYIQKRYKAKLVTYITDDYILPRNTISLFWWLRRYYILKKMKNIVQKSDLLITISEEMSSIYKELFNKDSILAMNMTESMKLNDVEIVENDVMKLVYAGGLHFNRFENINLLAKAIKKINCENGKEKLLLEVYSGYEPDQEIKKLINVEGASKFCGSLNQNELKSVLNNCDITVHVESFNKKSIESTRLSISTKIPEYLSLNKPILAIGPKEVASMSYLMDVALCVNNPEDIYIELKRLITDKALRHNLANEGRLKYEMNHNKDSVSTKLANEFNDLIETDTNK